METVSCCGIMCNECPVFIATERDDDSMRKFLAHEYSDGERKFYPKDISCCGCRTVSADCNKFGKGCEIRKCCKERHVMLCAECKNYPCDKIQSCVPWGSGQRVRREEMRNACRELLK